MPNNSENGAVLTDGYEKEIEKEILEPIGNSDDWYGEDVDFSYDFVLGLEHVGGSGSGGGASLVVGINVGGNRVEVEIPLEEGVKNYKGKIPIKLPTLSKGPIVIDYYVKAEDEDDRYYWFIRAGALWGFESEIPRDKVGEIPILEPKKLMIEFFKFFDYCVITKDSPGPSPSPTYQGIGELFKFIDTLNIETFIENLKTDGDLFSFSDEVGTANISEKNKKDKDGFSFSDYVMIRKD